MRQQVRGIALLGITWGTALVLPFFESDPGIFEIMVGGLVVAVLFYSIRAVLIYPVLNQKKVIIFIYWSFLFIFLSVFSLLKIGFPLPYKIWSRFGAGSMEKEGLIFPFGDLVHITAAAQCPGGGVLGSNSCDPWQRYFNQNPDLPTVLNFLRLSNESLLGVLAVVFIVFLLLHTTKKEKTPNLGVPIFLFSPVVVLAIERGNEVLTMCLITLGLLYLNSNSKIGSLVYTTVMFSAAFFKLWPLLLMALLAMFSTSHSRVKAFFAFTLGGLYWMTKVDEVSEMFASTQSGYPYGVSFGLKLFASHEANQTNTILLIAIALLSFLHFAVKNHSKLLSSFSVSLFDDKMAVLIPVILSYSMIWLFSESFIYRMFILLPAILILGGDILHAQRWAQSFLALILVTSITSKLAITTAISSSLALVSIYISAVYLVVRIKRAGTSTPHKSPRGLR